MAHTINLFVGLLLLFIEVISTATELPVSVTDALKKINVPLTSVSIIVNRVDTGENIIDVNAAQARNPASTMKLLTTFSALEILNPNYHWKTEIFLGGKLEKGTLYGDLIFKGGGDPKLTSDQLWIWLRELRQRGLKEIRGNIILDKSIFAPVQNDPAEFDHDPSRAYNVTPDALLLNFNALHLHLVPAQKSATVLLDPDLAGYIINNQISTTNEAICGNNDLINPQINSHTITLIGNIPNNCGELDEFFSLLPHDEYFFSVFSALWKELGGVFHGKVFIGSAPENQKAFSTHLSQPLSELIRDINKFSNNTMARQLFLTLSARNDTPANISQSSSVVQHWLNSIPLAMPELILENGAGLSRKERISAQHLADLLRLASQSRYAAEFESSLPLLGLDGTVKKRFKENELTGFAHLKTGTLDGVKSIAGYVQGKTGSKFILVFIVNHENAALSQPAQDLLIEWIYNNH